MKVYIYFSKKNTKQKTKFNFKMTAKTIKNGKLKENIIGGYSHFLSKYPLIIIFLSLIITVFSIYFSSTIENKSMEYKGMLPDTVEVIHANNMFTDNFGSSESVKYVIEIDSQYAKSNEYRDVRDPDVIKYASILEEYASSSTEITDVMSATETIKIMNGGTLPKDKRTIINMIENNPLLSSYFSEDGTMLVINFKLRDDYDEEKVVEDLEDTINSIKIPSGLKVNIGGDSISGVYVNKQLGNDMSKTSLISMLGIIMLLIITFNSIKYAFLPLTTIIIGMIWAFGYIGLMGLKMSSATSGVISMIMGIGIDFGIQIITRFRQELGQCKNESCDERIEQSMKNTMIFVLMPMFTTTLAAIIGFKAMTMGQLTIMQDMGDMMTYGVVFCFFAAITFVPALTIIIEKLSFKIKFKIKNKIRKKKENWRSRK